MRLTPATSERFPAHAGMNRHQLLELTRPLAARVPRTRGDEPESNMPRSAGLRVPRTRGDEPVQTATVADRSTRSPHTRG